MASALCLIFLVPGAFGAGSGGSALFVRGENYFADYRRYFESQGCQVKQGDLPPDATIEERSRILKDQVERFVRAHSSAKSSATASAEPPKAALIAHSRGGLDARYALKTLGLKGVRNLVTLGTPHQGTTLADRVIREREHRGPLYWLLRVFAGYDLDEIRFAAEVSPAFLKAHEESFAAMPGVRYGSAVASCTTRCHAVFRVLRLWTKSEGAGDGLVEASSQRWKEDLGTYDLDHISEIGDDAEKAGERLRFLERARDFLMTP